MKTDALGNPLIIGQVYGYSRVDNGITTVKIGRLVKINEQLITLEVDESKHGVYSDNLETRKIKKKTVSVKANGLFPVYTELLTKLKRLTNTETIEDISEMEERLEEISELLEAQTPHTKL